MNLTSQLRSQHSRILSMVSELETLIEDGSAQADATALHPKVCHLMGWVLVHLEFAQTEVYPTLSDSSAVQIGAEIAQIRPRLASFEARFRYPSEVAGSPEDFVAQVAKVCVCLRDRIGREQQLVYPVTNGRPLLPVNRLAYMTQPASKTRH